SSDPEIEVTRLYERDGSFSREALIERLEMGTHLVNHMGHGSEESFADLDVRDVEGLDGSDPFFLYTQACDVGGFDSLKSGDEDSIAEHLISAENGAFGVVANSRLGWYSPGDIDGPSQYYDLEFFDAIFDERIRSLGWALADSKEDLVSVVESTGFMRWCCMTLNLLGDPETEIHFIESREHDVAIVGLPSDTPFYGSPCTVKAVVRNLGVVDELAVPVELYADGVLVSVSFCDVPGGSSSEASFLWVPGELRPVLLTARCNLTSDLWRTNNELSSDVAITWRILDSQTVGDTTLTLACHVLVGAGGSLSLRNSTLTFDPIWGRAFDITVEGELMLNDSTIDAFEGFSLTTSNGSRFSAERSSFGDIVGNEGAGGFELQGNSGRIMNCSFVLAGGVVRLSGVSGWVVSNVSVESAASGIQIEESEGVTISGAVVHAAIAGVRVRNCSYISILGCTISGCELGLEIERSEGLRVQGNTITGNALDFGITGSSIVHYLHDIDSNNLTGGRLVYLVEREGIELAASLG
ncbi:MAG: hypothetical protein FJ151_05135, partial [Euryarchaeota archaeon]|nr:hypothetical protein [Euryarchaeota archaeon]